VLQAPHDHRALRYLRREPNVYKLSANPQINFEKVRNAMLCETCHNNRQRYAITDDTDSATVDYKILVDQSMPLGAHQDPMESRTRNGQPVDTLNLDERIALANCLQDELRIERSRLDQFLTQRSCQ
jgi:hypothetical protein